MTVQRATRRAVAVPCQALDNRPPYVRRQRSLGHLMLRPPTLRRRLASHPPLRWSTVASVASVTVDSDDELRVAALLEGAPNVIGWV